MILAPHPLERWLVLDLPVFEALRHEAADDHALLKFRLDHRLIEPIGREAVTRRLSELSAAGQRRAHLIVERLDAVDLARLRRCVRVGVPLQVHDWYRSPLDVMASVDAPDDFVLQNILAPSSEAQAITIWPPPGLAGSAVPVRGAYRLALQAWEQDAREAWGEPFSAMYGDTIDWQSLLPDPGLDRTRDQSHSGWLGGVTRLVAQAASLLPRPEASLAGLAYASSGENTLQWHYEDKRGEFHILVDLPSRPGANIELVATFASSGEAPSSFLLADERGDVIASVVSARWVVRESSGGDRVCAAVFADEFGHLRERFGALRVAPFLLLTTGTSDPHA